MKLVKPEIRVSVVDVFTGKRKYLTFYNSEMTYCGIKILEGAIDLTNELKRYRSSPLVSLSRKFDDWISDSVAMLIGR